MKKILLTWRTIRYLKLQQIFFRIYYAIITRLSATNNNDLLIGNARVTLDISKLVPFIPNPKSYTPPFKFEFLNKTLQFENSIDWNYNGHQKLWTYNLNYFDFLLQPGLTKEEGLTLINLYLFDIENIKDGVEPYAVSLRIVNWVKFCLVNDVRDEKIQNAIHGQTRHLVKNLEYHILANHLLENAYAVCIGSIYAGDDNCLRKGKVLLNAELKEQILNDGGHYERSPMYHQILLGRLLDLINLLNTTPAHHIWCNDLKKIASAMLGWIANVSFNNNLTPLINDSAFGIAPLTKSLLDYGDRLKIESQKAGLSESLFRKLSEENWELVADVGGVSPSYQPGHAHATTLGFELNVAGRPVIVNMGTSTYNPGVRRQLERSTKSGNTVTVNDENSSEVWASHRVGRRARVSLLLDLPDRVSAHHDGYHKFNVLHERSFIKNNEGFSILDNIVPINQKGTNGVTEAIARLHFHPDRIIKLIDNQITVDNEIVISFKNYDLIDLLPFEYAPEFNRYFTSQVCVVRFNSSLTTSFQIKS